MSDDICRIVFIGPPGSGKSTLMAAWYDRCSRVYEMAKDGEFNGTEYLLNIVHRISQQGQLPPATPPGPGFRARFKCSRKRSRGFYLELVDYSGETVRRALCEDADEANQDVDTEELRNDLRDAEAIVFVFHPHALLGTHRASENPDEVVSQQHENLVILKRLPAMRINPNPLERTYIYLSHADECEKEVEEHARELIHDALRQMNVSPPDVRIVVGASIVRKGNRVTFPAARSKYQQPRKLIREITTTFEASQGPVRPSDPLKHVRETLARFLPIVKRSPRKSATVAAILVALVAIVIWQINSAIDRGKWADHVEKFDELEGQENITYAQAQEAIKELVKWKERAERDFPKRYTEYHEKAESLAKRFESIPPPPPPPRWNDLIAELQKLRKDRGPDLKGFYQAVKTKADDEVKNSTWDDESRAEWKSLQSYAAALLAGVQIELDESWLQTPYFWTSFTGSGTLQLEVWIEQAANPQPFDHGTNGMDKTELVGGDVAYTGPIGDQYNYLWRNNGPEKPRASVSLDDQIWVRFYHYAAGLKKNGEYFSVKVPRLIGPDLLGWFNRSQSHDNGTQSLIRLKLYDAAGLPLAEPKSLKNIFAE